MKVIFNIEKYSGLKDKRSLSLFFTEFFNAVLKNEIPFQDVLKILYNHLDEDCQKYYQWFCAENRRLRNNCLNRFLAKSKKFGYICYNFAKVFSPDDIEKIVEIVNCFIRISIQRRKSVSCFPFLSINNSTKNIKIEEKSVLCMNTVSKKLLPPTLSSSPTSFHATRKARALNVKHENKNIGRYRTLPKQFSQNYSEIKQSLLKNGELFEDPEFVVENTDEIEWLRPWEIVDEPLFIIDGTTRFDVVQGRLGDCWLLAAISNLTLEAHKKTFNKIVDGTQSFSKDYAGIFKFQFWRYGEWIEIVIDDRLPTFNGELLYLHSSEKNEFWSALLEKAYAKLYGSYEALDGGSTVEALEDMTGGLTEIMDIVNYPPHNLLKMLCRGFEMGTLFGCSTGPEDSDGLIGNHAYSITGVEIIVNNRNGPIPLIRIRNPWGDENEYVGPYCDNSPLWNEISSETKRKMKLKFKNDGEFWMPIEDVINNFGSLEVCHVDPKIIQDIHDTSGKRLDTWSEISYHGEWSRGKSAGGSPKYSKYFASNPQYFVKLMNENGNDFCTLIIGVLQKYTREQKGAEHLAINFAIYKSENLQRKLDKSFFEITKPVFEFEPAFNGKIREISARIQLSPGEYVIIPFTANFNNEANFMLRIFADCLIKSNELL